MITKSASKAARDYVESLVEKRFGRAVSEARRQAEGLRDFVMFVRKRKRSVGAKCAGGIKAAALVRRLKREGL